MNNLRIESVQDYCDAARAFNQIRTKGDAFLASKDAPSMIALQGTRLDDRITYTDGSALLFDPVCPLCGCVQIGYCTSGQHRAAGWTIAA